ncbi:hypothetical protein ACIBKY_06785 [Nonomuraea sp. NPDC050394]|uniref:hypothetical protein n=1 Tax=Nonomuraea sp. NPDC050394 TaxID=3364363 RepID=UPI003798AE2C
MPIEKKSASPFCDWSTSKAWSGAMTTAALWFSISSESKEIFMGPSALSIGNGYSPRRVGVGDVRDEVLVVGEHGVAE